MRYHELQSPVEFKKANAIPLLYLLRTDVSMQGCLVHSEISSDLLFIINFVVVEDVKQIGCDIKL